MIKKYFTETQIYTATFFGGPVPAGILIYKNLRRIEEDKKASLTLLFTIIGAILLFYGIMHVPDAITDRIPSLLYTAIFSGIVYLVYRPFVADKINAELLTAENKISNWSVAGYTFLGLCINLIIIMAIAFAEPTFPGEKMVFGQMQHELFYDKEFVTEEEAQKTGDVLTDFGYFGDDLQQAVKIESKQGELRLIFPLQKELWNDPEISHDLYMMKDKLKDLLNRDINLVLTHYQVSGKTYTKVI